MIADWSSQLLRSLLFAPGNQPRKLAKVASFGADAIILDLEDAVPVTEKERARALARAALPGYQGPLRMVRVNALSTGLAEADLQAVVDTPLDAVLLPKVDSPETLAAADALLARLEAAHGVPVGGIRLFPLIESARGVARVEEIACHAPPRVHTLLFGPADFTADLGIALTPDATETLYARSRIVVACRAAGLASPIDGPYLLDLHDQAGLLADSRRGRQLGFQGRAVIYPPHVELVNQVYSDVSPEEIAFARKVVQAFETALAAGSAATQVEDRLVDYPIYHQALRKLRLHQGDSR